MGKLDKNTGALLTANEGAKILQDYLDHEGIDPNNPPLDRFWATYFGINKMKKLIAEIDSYNEGPKPNGEIMGVRIYKCREEVNSVQVESVMLVPVTSDEKDLYPVRFEKDIEQLTPNMILENGKPCPPFCGGGRP